MHAQAQAHAYYTHNMNNNNHVAPAQALVHAPAAAHGNVPVLALAPAPAPAPNGGVSMVLDYDMDHMVRFLSWVTFGLVKAETPSVPSQGFQSSINSVLSATRLPKSTLLLAISYLSDKTERQVSNEILSEDDIFKTLITALILANKFNDDKTFKNKSWSDATNLPLLEINALERSWLANCHYGLAKTQSYAMVDSCWNTWCAKNIQSLDTMTVNLNSGFNMNTNMNLTSPMTPVSTAPSSPLINGYCQQSAQYSSAFTTPYRDDGRSCSNMTAITAVSDFDNNFISNQIFENPFHQPAQTSLLTSVPVADNYATEYNDLYSKHVLKTQNDSLAYYSYYSNQNMDYQNAQAQAQAQAQSYCFDYGYAHGNNGSVMNLSSMGMAGTGPGVPPLGYGHDNVNANMPYNYYNNYNNNNYNNFCAASAC